MGSLRYVVLFRVRFSSGITNWSSIYLSTHDTFTVESEDGTFRSGGGLGATRYSPAMVRTAGEKRILLCVDACYIYNDLRTSGLECKGQ